MSRVKPPSGTVTFLFTDIEASTRKWEQDASSMQRLMAHHDALMREAIESHGGFVFTTAGDSFCAAFGDPGGALESAIRAQTEIEAFDWYPLEPFRVRMALHTGNADERDGDYFGPPLNRCARLLSIGHGGQILASSATRSLLRDALIEGVEFVDLGAHALKDLEREEHVYQVAAFELNREFPALRTGMVRDAADAVATARQAFARERWQEAYAAYEQAAEVFDLDAEDTERFADAALWTGRADDAVRLREAAYAAYITAGKEVRAAVVAVALSEAYHHRLASTVARSWLARAEALFAGHEDSVEYGYLLRRWAIEAFEHDGDTDRGLALAQRVRELGRSHGDRTVEALGLQDEGRFLVALGRIDDGMRLMDEAMVAAVGGELTPDATGRSYCNMLAVCDDVADYERAGDWADAAAAWCESHSDSAFPGVCRIFSAEVKWLRGSWDVAAGEIRRAVEELSGFTDIIGAAWYQLGEIELRAGRHEAAEEMFRTAHENGRIPIPGMAALYLQRGDAGAAAELLGEALEPGRLRPLARARLLPTWIEAQIGLGNLEEAGVAVAEMEETCRLTGSAAFDAATAVAKGRLALAQSDPTRAVPHLDEAVAGWTKLKMPYEAAEARVLLAEARLGTGKRAAARLDLDAARSAFDRLGATGDAARAESLLG